MKLENALSPMIRNRGNIQSQTFDPDDINLINQIKKLKLDVIHQRIDKRDIDLIRPEVVDSWIRSFSSGLSVYEYNYAPALEGQELLRRRYEKAMLLDSSAPFIHQLDTMMADSECIILLSDEQGCMLRVLEGSKKLADQNKRFKLVEGSVWNESTIGTCAHGISLIHEIPMQICGPEHYCEKYDNIFCSAAPIFDGNQNLTGTLSFVSPSYHQQNAHSLGLVVSMAWAIQRDIKLLFNQELLDVTMNSADVGVIAVNKNGIITQANAIARDFFEKRLDHNMTGMPYTTILGQQGAIESVLNDGEPVFDLEILLDRWDQRINLVSAQSIPDASGQNLGCIITFKKIDPIKKSSPSSTLRTRYDFSQIIGDSEGIKHCVDLSHKFASLEANILIQGESGTGKEMFAHSIHRDSRPDGPFVAVNCAAIPSTLIESELFGYAGGSFTGAEKQGRPGKIELANQGTLFLDEIGDMPLELQPVLLRVLDEKRVMRIGSSQYLPVDFRLITATNRDLDELVEKDLFRKDLLYRLKVLQVNIPPLRRRGEDIARLARHFVKRIALKQRIKAPEISDELLLALLNYDWPGNVRQLENAILYAVNVSNGSKLEAAYLPEDIKASLNSLSLNKKKAATSNNLTMKEIEKIFIGDTLLQCNYNISEAAAMLKMSRATLYRKIKEYQLAK
ncbi:MAG TPA: sigma 54-interacting transcriptional regulator [Syntrophomonas sp.]|nr:sigma 54-interacting transcriptional regulator [Syntrophomonas sp.]